MSKIERGRISGFYGMASHTSADLVAWADRLESQISDPHNTDDPKWLKNLAEKLRRLAVKKERSHAHKERQQ